jgi:hypothetical protein
MLNYKEFEKYQEQFDSEQDKSIYKYKLKKRKIARFKKQIQKTMNKFVAGASCFN